jgi:hypothetical protein
MAPTEVPSGVGVSEHLFEDRVLSSDHGKFHSQGHAEERGQSPQVLLDVVPVMVVEQTTCSAVNQTLFLSFLAFNLASIL